MRPRVNTNVMEIRVGFGYDVHRLESGEKLRLGGVDIPAQVRAVGHSDADVLIHAVCDALLGAAGLADIGHHFPNEQDEWKGRDSRHFLEAVMRMLSEKGWGVGNVDCTVSLEQPRIAPHIQKMKTELAPRLGIGLDALSIKATTEEGLDDVGRSSGIRAYAVALILKS